MNARLQQYLPFILFTLAVGFLVLLLSTIKDFVFFSGDAGLKFLMVKQIAKGGSYATLNIESPQWVRHIWSQGFYPFKEPFVYPTPQGSFISFPPAFQWLNSWLYRWFGFKGIYIIPFFSTVILWLWFINTMKRAGVKPIIISTAFFLLSFCSPLTIYGALYWEHSVSILLLFSGLAFMVIPGVSLLRAWVCGLLAGMSVWFRPEMLLLCVFIIIILLVNNFKQKKKQNLIFIMSMLISIAAFLTFNNKVYDNLLGAHSYQLMQPGTFAHYFLEKCILLLHLNARLVLYFPLMILFFILAVYLSLKKRPFANLLNQLTVITILFLVLAPFVLPNGGGKQWGPRYFLLVIPIVIMVLCLAASQFQLMKMYKWTRIILVLTAASSFYLNVYMAHNTLKNDYAYRVKPALDFLDSKTTEVLIVQNQFIAQEFSVLFDTRKIFLAEDQPNFDKLKKLLETEKITTVIYISHDAEFKRTPDNLINNSRELSKIGDYYFAEYDFKHLP